MAGVAFWKGAERLDHAYTQEWRLLPRERVSNDDVGKNWSVKEASFTFQIDGSHLLRHAVKVMRAPNGCSFIKFFFEDLVANGDFGHFFPASCVEQDSLRDREH